MRHRPVHTVIISPEGLHLPFPLPVIQARDMKKKCCKKFKKGKRCKKCPGRK